MPNSAPAPRYHRYGLILEVTRRCGFACDYCYAAPHGPVDLPPGLGQRAIDRALAALEPGGTLELRFFGGEPLLVPGLLDELCDHVAARLGFDGFARIGLTTNGSRADRRAVDLLKRHRIDVAVSHDGLPAVHDRHRRDARGRATSGRVLRTIDRLLAAGIPTRAVMVVRPDTVERLPDGIRFLHGRGVTHVEPVLDLHAAWTDAVTETFDRAIAESARVWAAGLPGRGVAWFDEKLARITGICPETARCGFGRNEVAVSARGNVYPCERLIGADEENNPHIIGGRRPQAAAPRRSHPACLACDYAAWCDTTCRCGNLLRTGDPARPDGLLCRLNKLTIRETLNALAESNIGIEIAEGLRAFERENEVAE